jgi:outer membrane receptor protein involved in Fe transport
MSRPRLRRSIGGASALLACLLTGSAALSQEAGLRFQVTSRPLGEALVTLALQSGLSISDTGVDFASTRSHAVDGRYTPSQALAALLSGTPFGFVFLDRETVRITAQRETPRRPATPPPEAVETIVVTSTKRAEIALQTPYALQIVKGTTLHDAGMSVPADLAAEAAGFSASSSDPGQDKLFIRGLSDSAFAGHSQSVVGLYLNDAQLTEDAPDPSLRLVDVDRVEIIRGPQGTLYGAGTLAGLVRIMTNRPALDGDSGTVEVSGAGTQGAAASGGINAVVNMRLVPDRWALRVVGYGQDDGGYINDIRLHRHDVNTVATNGGRAALRGLVGDDWSLTLSLTGQHINDADTAYAMAGLPPLTRASYAPEPRGDSFLQADVALDASFGWADLASSTAATLRDIHEQFDATLAWTALTRYPLALALFRDSRAIRTLTHETRLSSVPGGSWSWVGGVYLAAREEDYRSSLQGLSAASLSVTARRLQRADTSLAAAGFGEVTKALPWKLFLSAGLRVSITTLGANSLSVLAPFQPPSVASGVNESMDISPRLVLSARPKEWMTLYASVSKGYRPGGINIDAPAGAININLPPPTSDDGRKQASAFAPDELYTFELGAKAAAFGGRFDISGALWLTQWNNVQTDQITPDGTPYTANIGNVRDPGLELDVTAQPFDGLVLHAGGFLSDPELQKSNPTLVTAQSELPASPRQSFNFSSRYAGRLSEDARGFVSLRYAYTGRSYLNYDPREAPPMGAYGTVDVRVGVSKLAWRAALFVDNALDNSGNTLAFGNSFLLGRVGQITPLRPRTIGFELRRNF